ncbi:hypothetical protein PENSPDRAFT_653201 [Peniophora sp. CONT]|nr:hypothetical protein PENSPDRAFT_653201 [Peniophora sp. CONT]
MTSNSLSAGCRPALTHALVHSGTAPTPGTFLRCTRACVVANQVFVRLANLNDAGHDAPLTAEAIAGALPAVGSIVRCTQRAESYIALEATSSVPRDHWLFRISSEDRTRILLHAFGEYACGLYEWLY